MTRALTAEATASGPAYECQRPCPPEDCELLGLADVDGDGTADRVELLGKPDSSGNYSNESPLAVRVVTASGSRTIPLEVDFCYGTDGLYAGATDLDTDPGKELVLGAGGGAHVRFYSVLTDQDEELRLLPPWLRTR